MTRDFVVFAHFYLERRQQHKTFIWTYAAVSIRIRFKECDSAFCISHEHKMQTDGRAAPPPTRCTATVEELKVASCLMLNEQLHHSNLMKH